MKTFTVLTSAILALSLSLTASAQVARPSDREVEKQIDAVQKSGKDFGRSLDPDLRRGTVRGKTTEVNVANFLEDFDAEIARLRDRFEQGYSARGEVINVL